MASTHILLVEDLEETVILTREFLTIRGDHTVDYTVDSADSMASAHSKLIENQYDIILLDYSLPDGDGLQALRMITDMNIDTPVVMITGRGDERIAVKSVKAGAVDYIVKKINYLDALPELITRVIQQHELRRAVSEAEARYRYLFEQANDGIFVCDTDGVILDANQNACEWLQIARDALAGRNLSEFERPDSTTSSKRLRAALVREGELVYEIGFCRADGDTFPAEVSARQVQQGKNVFHQYFVRDITHRKNMEAEILRRSRELAALSEVTAAINRSLDFNEVLNTALDGVMGALRNDYGAIYLEDAESLALVAHRGFPDDFVARIDAVSKADLEEPDMPAPPGVLPDWLQEDDITAYLIAPLISRDNRLGFLLLVDRQREVFSGDEFNFVRVNCDRIAAAIENARLLSDLQESVKATRVAQAQLVRAARLSAVGELAAGVAHQINNPLTTVIADAQLLLKLMDEEHPGHVSAEAIYQAGWRAQRVVQGLLNFARPEEERFEPTEVNHTINAALELLGAYLERSGVNLQITLDPELPPMMAAGHQLEEMWINLLLNARDALSDKRDGIIAFQSYLAEDGSAVEVKISDNGNGISPEDLQNVFEPFYTTKGEEGGTGLGLSVCQTIAQHHSGYIRVDSQPDEGTEFIVHLPLTQETARLSLSRARLVRNVLDSD